MLSIPLAGLFVVCGRMESGFRVSIEALEIAIEALKERLAIDHETMESDFGEVELRGIEKIGDESE